jgi:hypothetical protein
MPKPNSRQIAQQITGTSNSALGGGFFWFVMFCGLLVFTVWSSREHGRQSADDKRDHQHTPDDGKGDGKKVVPDDKKNDQANQKTEITGTVLFVHAREPISPELSKLLDDATTYAVTSGGKFSMRSLDVLDPNADVKKIIASAKASNIDPPFMVHKETKVFAPIPSTFQAVKDKYGR